MKNRAYITALFVITLAALAWLAPRPANPSPAALGEHDIRLIYPPFLRLPPAGYEAVFSASMPPELADAEERLGEGFGSRNFFPALKAYKKALRRDPGARWKPQARFRVAECYHRMGHYHEAASSWLRAIKLTTRNDLLTRAEASLAECLFKTRRYRDALVIFQELRKSLYLTREDRAWALYRLGDCLVELGMLEEAARRFREAESLGLSSRWVPLESLNNMVLMAFGREDYRSARFLLFTALSFHGSHHLRPRWLYLLGETYLREGREVPATLVFKGLRERYSGSRESGIAEVRLAALRVKSPDRPFLMELGAEPASWADPHHPVYFNNPADVLLQRAVLELGLALIEKERNETALRVLLNALRKFHETGVTPVMRGVLIREAENVIGRATEKGEHDRSIKHFDEISQTMPEAWENAGVLLDVALSYEENGFFEMAASLYERAGEKAEKGPEKARAALGLARAELSLGRGEDAVALLSKAGVEARVPDTAPGLFRWAADSKDLAFKRSAARWLRETARGRLSLASVVLEARYYLEMREIALCAGFLRGALKEAPPEDDAGSELWAEAWSLRGEALGLLGRPEEAMACFERVASRESWGFNEKWAAYRLVRLGVETGKKKEVKGYLERLLAEPQGSYFNGLATLFKNRMNAPSRGKG